MVTRGVSSIGCVVEPSVEPGTGALVVCHGDEKRIVQMSSTLSFGRDAEFVIDAENPYLHRVLGVFVCTDGVWFVQNVGRFITLALSAGGRPSRSEVAPGTQAALLQREMTIGFVAGKVRYELGCTLEEARSPSVRPIGPSDTIQFGRASLNAEQRLLVTALAEPLLRGDPSWPASMPANREVAHRLGWTVTKFNRKLDYLCRRLASFGVEGLQGDSASYASARRLLLVEHLVEQGSVTPADLVRLQALDGD